MLSQDNLQSRDHTVNIQAAFKSETHTHASNMADAFARFVVNTMVSSAGNGHEITRIIIRDAIQGCSQNSLATLLSTRNHKLNPTPQILLQRHGFNIPYEYSKLTPGLRYLQYVSAADDDDFILASNNNLDVLSRQRHLLADAPFQCTTKVFYPFFRNQHTYQRMLLHFSKLSLFIPESILTDFECALIDAV
ncbi:hypothetical protein RF11_06876 [Thelohanellus kitauei]|uniref:Uncharacterized protein n=1 Tax=Thelohanellus kitauei TaxID=669202 RepID=A0A0C2MD60_THEKT|nr:hypothetical protein RF11_06876 [Thelohanellus kitauei]